MPIDYSKYPDNWKTEIRPRIMNRANNRCEFPGCDFVHLEEVWSVKSQGRTLGWYRNYEEAAQLGEPTKVRVIITVAHLDHDEHNGSVQDSQLKAACQLCHLRYDAAEKVWRQRLKDCPILLKHWRP